MTLQPGTTLGPYRVTAKIGEGGMGEVYRARDTKLDRDVALKVLPQAFTEDPDRLARFEREAKVLASLNHPNIGGIHGLEESDGIKALVLEYIEGPTLADRIAQGPIPVDEALPIAKQIAEALEEAHEQGVIHRDPKPANVKVRPDGTVKVLDFGLARAFQPDASDVSASMSPTISLTAAATQMGMVIGTAAYMSPEQARGQPADRRADICAFGVVLYEMLTGDRAFKAEDISLTLADVMRSEPAWQHLPSDIPPAIRMYLQRCLRKDPKERIRDIGDVRLALEDAFEAPASGPAEATAAPQLQVWQRPIPAVVATLTLVIVSSLAVWSFTRPTPSPPDPVARFSIPLGADEAFTRLGRHLVALSPDGTQLVYQANNQLYLRQLDQLEATVIPGTRDGDGRSPFISPDGQWIGFYAGGQLKKVAMSGGAPVALCNAANPWGASWGTDDMILYGQGANGIWRVPGTGGTPEEVIAVEEGEQAHGPQMLPGGEWVLFTFRIGTESWDEAQIVVQSLVTDERVVLIEGGQDARYLSTGHLVYALNGVLLAVPFDLGGRRVTGGPVPLVEDVHFAPTQTGAAHFSVADNGSLVYVPALGITGSRTLVWVDREGREEPLAAPPRRYVFPRISPDGTRVVLDARDQEDDLWIWDLARETPTRFTFDPGPDWYPVWTPDS